jgi:hypothetical protein
VLLKWRRADLDECVCGDFRRSHPLNGRCRVFGNHSIPELRCDRFRFVRQASAEEIARQERLELLVK